MVAPSRPRPTRADVRPGVYLTDGAGLYRVTDRHGAAVLLEDCSRPPERGGELVHVSVAHVVARMRLVKLGGRGADHSS